MSEETELKLKFTAEDGISGVAEKIIEALGDTKLGHTLTALSTSFTAVSHIAEKVGQTFEAISAKFEAAVHAAAEHEVAEKKLGAALQITGQYSEAAVKELDHLADSIAKNNAVSEEGVRSAISLGLSYGMSAEQAKIAAQTAVDLAAATNKDVNTAMRELTITLSGTTGRLGQTIPELKGFTDAQLQAGAGINFLHDRLKDFAKTMGDTYEGAVKRAELAQNKMTETIGNFIIHSDLARASLAAKAEMYELITTKLEAFEGWLHENAATIHTVTEGIKAAAIAYGLYFVAINAAIIGQIAFNAVALIGAAAVAVIESPITLTVAAVLALGAAFAYFGVNTDHMIGLVKALIAVAITPLTVSVGMLTYAVGALVGIINKDFGDSIKRTGEYIGNYSMQLYNAGEAQFAAGEATRVASKAHSEHAVVLDKAAAAAAAHEQEMKKLSAAYARAAENAKPAIDALKEFAPRLSLIDWERDRGNFESQLDKLKSSATVVIKTIKESGGPQGEGEKALLDKATIDVQRASEAQTALKIKNFEIYRETAIKNADVWIEYEKQKAISASDEIKLKKIAAAEETRSKLIEIRTAELMEDEGLQKHYLDIEAEANKKARDEDLNAYQQMLDTQLALAVDHETNIAIARAEAGKSVAGLDPVAKAQTEAALTEEVETAHQAKIQEALNMGLISQATAQREGQASKMAQLRASHAEELAEYNQRAELLGLSDAAVRERQAAAEVEHQDNLKMIKEDALLSDDERRLAIEESELSHQARLNEIKESNIQAEITRADQLHDYWGVTLGKIELEQEKHGKVVGAIMGVAHSQQFQALNTGLSNMSSLRNSHSKKAFEIGKSAATAQAVIQTFLGATEAATALYSVPLIGPALAVAAAAAALAAGFVNVQNIQSQKFQAAHGGIDEVPAGLDNSTFLLKGGERVLQPEANKEVTQAARSINDGKAAQNVNVNITIYGTPSNDQVDQMKKAIFDAIRDASERGQPIINERGVVKAS